MLAVADERLKLYFIDEFLDDRDVYKAIALKGMTPTLDEVVAAADQDADDLDQRLLQQRLEELCVEMKRAFDTLVPLVPLVPIDEEHEEWTDFRRAHDLEIRGREVWAWSYEVLCEARAEEARAQAEQSLGSPFVRMARLAKGLDLYPIAGASQVPIQSQWDLAHETRLKAQRDDADAELRVLRQERRMAEETYDATRQPEGFKLALQVLSAIAVLGLALPVVVMAFAPMALPGWFRAVIVAAFMLGVGLLLRFLFAYAAFLHGSGGPLPRHLGALLLPRVRRRKGSGLQPGDQQPVAGAPTRTGDGG